MAEAEEFYEGKLGLMPVAEEPDGGRVYAFAGGTSLHVYPSPRHAGTATSTLATWDVTDIEAVVRELTANGVRFEQFEERLKTDERGIAGASDGDIAWFQDPD